MRRADNGIERPCSRCGETKPVSAFYARGHCRRSHCKACVRAYGREARKQASLERPHRVLLDGARARSRQMGIAFTLTEADIEIPAICPVLGIALERGFDRRGPTEASPTLDRIIPERGYVRGNVVVVSWRANRLKSDATLDELDKLIEWYSLRAPPT